MPWTILSSARGARHTLSARNSIWVPRDVHFSGYVGGRDWSGDVHVLVSGTLSSVRGWSLQLDFLGMFVEVESGGEIRSFDHSTIEFVGINSHLTNAGLISQVGGSEFIAVYYRGDSTESPDPSTLVNTGEIRADGYGIFHRDNYGTLDNWNTLVVTNEGRIAGKTGSFFGEGVAVDIITNRGVMVGSVTLGGGNDKIDTTLGTVQGKIDLGAGNDTAYGSAAADTVVAGDGNDIVRGNGGKDSLDGGLGSDYLDYREKTVAVSLTLKGATASAALVNGVGEDSFKNFENVYGGSGKDKFTGDGQGNRLYGHGGDDSLDGSAGSDFLFGGAGKDTLKGGLGADAFRFDATIASTNIETITDFNHTDDRIELENAIFTKLSATPGMIAQNVFLSAASGHNATSGTQRIIYDRSNGQIWYDATGNTNGSTDAKQIATLSTKPGNVDYTDFFIV